jgi:hypothetical protein
MARAEHGSLSITGRGKRDNRLSRAGLRWKTAWLPQQGTRQTSTRPTATLQPASPQRRPLTRLYPRAMFSVAVFPAFAVFAPVCHSNSSTRTLNRAPFARCCSSDEEREFERVHCPGLGPALPPYKTRGIRDDPQTCVSRYNARFGRAPAPPAYGLK